jgi:ABC-type nitrate/sulfonate/bicarbonate transport system substrate-binding protein
MRAWLATIASAAALAAHAEPTTLHVMGFAGAANAAVFVAQDKGFFAARALEVQLSAAPNSATQIALLRDGHIDIALTAMDNIVPYPGELFAFLGVNDGGRMSLMVAPEIQRTEQLRGRALAVDALSSGYAFVLMEMLAHAGLAPGSYELESIGGSRERFAAMKAGRVAGALLNAPTDSAAEGDGFRRVAIAAEVIPRYQGSVGAARRNWAAGHADALMRYISAHVAALDWLYDPENRSEAVQLLAQRLNLDAPAAERSYAELLEQHGAARKGVLDVEGIRTVLALRAKYASSRPSAADPARYYDLSYYVKALAQ